MKWNKLNLLKNIRQKYDGEAMIREMARTVMTVAYYHLGYNMGTIKVKKLVCRKLAVTWYMIYVVVAYTVAYCYATL